MAGETEEGIYEALGLAYRAAGAAREPRRDRGGRSRTLPRLIDAPDLRGDLHMHTTATDGRADAGTMARAARGSRASSTSRLPITARRSRWPTASTSARALEHAARDPRAERTRRARRHHRPGRHRVRHPGRRPLDLADDCLAELDIVIASVHSAFDQDEAQMTDRLLRAIECPWVDILGHPTGRLILQARAVPRSTWSACSTPRLRHGVAVEINSQIERLDLDDMHARRARERGVQLVIDSDAHSPAALGNLRWGVAVARRAWLEAEDVLNTRPFDEFRRRCAATAR